MAAQTLPDKIKSFTIVDENGTSKGTADLTVSWEDVLVNLNGQVVTLKDLLALMSATSGSEKIYYDINKSIMKDVADKHELLATKLFGIYKPDGVYSGKTFLDGATAIKNNFKPKGYTLNEITIDGKTYYYPVPTTTSGTITQDYADYLEEGLNTESLFQSLLEQSYWWMNAFGEHYDNGSQNGNSIMNKQDMLTMFPVMISSAVATSNEGE